MTSHSAFQSNTKTRAAKKPKAPKMPMPKGGKGKPFPTLAKGAMATGKKKKEPKKK